MALSHTIPIRDGYDEKGYIAEQPRLYPALRFTFRPMLADRRDTISREFARKTAAQFHLLMAGEIAARVTEWDAANEKGVVVPVNVASIRSMRPKLFDRLYNVIAGEEPGDPDPLAEEEAQREESALLMEAAAGVAREVRDEKNSGTG